MTFRRRFGRAAFGISPEETRVHRRGFHSPNSEVTERLERVGREFLGGYHAALEESSVAILAARLNATVQSEWLGFAFEGAAMGLLLLDELRMTRGWFPEFVRGPGSPHIYMVHVGAGWAIARLPWLRPRVDRVLAKLDPVLRWLAVDGYGFHEGYFHWPERIERHVIPSGVSGYAARAFDQGLGRSLWFVEGTDPERIAARIHAFLPRRRPDLWAGAGLAAAYAGGAGSVGLSALRQLAGEFQAEVAQGAAFAAAARARAGNPTANCDRACEILCGMPAQQAGELPIEEMRDLPADAVVPSYEVWRMRLQARLGRQAAGRVVARGAVI